MKKQEWSRLKTDAINSTLLSTGFGDMTIKIVKST